MQGASPLASPGLSGARHWLDLPVRHSAGGLLSCLPANPAFGFLFCPPSPKGKDIPPTRARRALFPGGKGENHSFLMQGASPLASPGAGRGAALARPKVSVCLRGAVPAAKERGDRGRWNYPSQATAAFEMVLSPRGRASQCRAGASPQRIFALSFYSSKGIWMPRAERREQKSRTRSGR